MARRQVNQLVTRQTNFLNSLKAGWSVSKAVDDAKLSRSIVYLWREQDPQFAAAWDEALEIGVDAFEDVASTRAKGIKYDVVDEKTGKVIGSRFEHSSERLLELMLKAKRPQVYARDNNAPNQTVNVIMPTLADLNAKYAAAGLKPPPIEGDFTEVKKIEKEK
jgi:hypothetical protein